MSVIRMDACGCFWNRRTGDNVHRCVDHERLDIVMEKNAQLRIELQTWGEAVHLSLERRRQMAFSVEEKCEAWVDETDLLQAQLDALRSTMEQIQKRQDDRLRAKMQQSEPTPAEHVGHTHYKD